MTSPVCRVFFFLFSTLLSAARESTQKSTPASPIYRAAVVEYEPVIRPNDPMKTIEDNAEKFVDFIGAASNENVDIIVFPELALTPLEIEDRSKLVDWASVVPHPSENRTPCENSTGALLRNISCAAKNGDIYVVVNIVEMETACSFFDGTGCAEQGYRFYSTNVAFDRRGKIVARYRKSNGFNEFGPFDMPKSKEISTIDTDFGVTFGNAIGFDILHEEPGITLTRKFGLTDIVCPTAWYSSVPFMTAIQIQAGWSHAKDVNLLAAGYNRFNRGNFGSGIYAGRHGPLKITSPVSGNRVEMLVSEVTKMPKKPLAAISSIGKANNRGKVTKGTEEDRRVRIIHDELRRKRDLTVRYLRRDKFEGFETRLVKPDEDDGRSSIESLSHDKIVCKFRANLTGIATATATATATSDQRTTNPRPIYRYVAYDGAYIYDEKLGSFGVKICALVLCGNESIESCGQPNSAPVYFDSIEIEASFDNHVETLMTPNTLSKDLVPVSNDKWTFSKPNEGEGRATISLADGGNENLVTFGLWGRNFAASGADFLTNMFDPMTIYTSLVFTLWPSLGHGFFLVSS